MTFSEALDDLRNRKLVEASQNFYADTDLLTLLIDASIEVASSLSFPQKVVSVALSSGATTITAPADMLAAQLGQISIGGFRLRPTDYATYQFFSQLSGVPRAYNYDPRRGGDILIAPATSGTMAAALEYTAQLYTSGTPTDASVIWGTLFSSPNYTTPLFPQFHDIVVLRAAVKAYQMSQEADKANYYVQAYQQRLQEFAVFLGHSDIASLMLSTEKGK